MDVLESAMVDDIAPLLQIYFIGTLFLALVTIVSVTLACASAVEINRDYEATFNCDSDGENMMSQFPIDDHVPNAAGVDTTDISETAPQSQGSSTGTL